MTETEQKAWKRLVQRTELGWTYLTLKGSTAILAADRLITQFRLAQDEIAK